MKFRTFHLGKCIWNVVCTRAGILLRPKFNQTNTKQNIVLLGCTVVHVTMWSKCTYLWFTLLQLSDQFHYSNVRWVSWHFTSHDWQLDCLLNSLISLIKEKIQDPFHYPFCEGNLLITGGFSSQRASYPHHDFIMCKSDHDSGSSPMLLFIIYIALVVRSIQCVVMRLYDWMALGLMEWKSAQGHENEICLP